MAQYNADVSKIPLSRYWSDKNDPKTHASAKSYIPEIPWNDSCASRLIFTDPLIAGNYSQAFGEKGFCNSSVGQQFFLFDVAGGGGPSSCFTGTPSTPGVVSGTCKGNPKPSYQKGVEGVPHDGVRDQPDLSLFAADGVWGSFYPFCLIRHRTRWHNLHRRKRRRPSRWRRHILRLARDGRHSSAHQSALRQARQHQLRLLRSRSTTIRAHRQRRPLRRQPNLRQSCPPPPASSTTSPSVTSTSPAAKIPRPATSTIATAPTKKSSANSPPPPTTTTPPTRPPPATTSPPA